MKKLIIILSLFLCIKTIHAQSEKFKALFVYNFAKMISWNEANKKGDFIIVVYGNSPKMLNELKKTLKGRKVGNQNVIVKKVDKISQLTKCHILFIPDKETRFMKQLHGKFEGKNTLIVTEKKGMANQGAEINLLVKNDRLMFEVNKKNIEKEGLKISLKLLKLAILVE